jgi:di/tricarboxylate transporter
VLTFLPAFSQLETPMTHQLAVVLALLCAAILMFALNKPRMDAVALIMLTVLPFTGVITMGEALAGFSDPTIVLIAALFVLGDGLVRTGVARRLGDWLTATAGGNEIRLVILLMLVVAGLGATMSSTAVTAIFIPVVLRIALGADVSPSGLMMPLSVAALISGMTTLVATTPNLIVNSELIRHLKEKGQVDPTGFHFFSFTPFGVPVLILGIIYMLFARRWLTSRTSRSDHGSHRPSLRDWIEEYQLATREHRVRITDRSPMIGKTVGELRLRDTSGATLVAIERNRRLIQPAVSTELRAGDILFVDLSAANTDLPALRNHYGLEESPLSGEYFTDLSQEIGMAEVIVPANSDFVDKTVIEADFRSRYGLTVVGLRRGGTATDISLQNKRLKIGDTLLVIGPWKSIRKVQSNGKDLVVFNLPVELEEVLPVAGKALHAVACLALVVGLMISGVIPNVQAALIGCLLMGVLGCVNLNSAYRAIDWKSIVLIVGMLPFSVALERTGGVEMAASGLMTLVGEAGNHAVLATLFAITSILGMFISNTATAVLMAPIAVTLADDMHASPYPFAMIVALAASTAFMTPVSSPVNTLVVTPGNYTFGDFAKVGVPFSLIVLVVSVILVPWLLPL